MTEDLMPYTVARPPASSVPRDLFNFWRRVLKLERGRQYLVVLTLPERHDGAISWTFLGDGKKENDG